MNDCVSMRESKERVEGLNSMVKLQLYKSFGKEVDFKTYLQGVSDAGTRLLFKFRSGTHGLYEELSRHRGRNGRTECIKFCVEMNVCPCFMGVSCLQG